MEVAAIVAAYLDLLVDDLAGRATNKAALNRQLQQQTGRSRGSIEFKMCNISAVMDELGLPWVRGYAPRRNFQHLLTDAVRELLPARMHSLLAPASRGGTREPSDLFVGQPPARSIRPTPEHVQRLVRKFDPVVRDFRNRQIGEEGEALVYRREKDWLRQQGRADLARKVVWTAKEVGDGAGYDIASFEPDGRERLIEVKTTPGSERTPFYITENELAVSEDRSDVFCLMRVYDIHRAPRAFELRPPLASAVTLAPSVYKARFTQRPAN
ncbi:protein NO VEIN domain-containing protein [Maricaulis sp. CAU 1757]